MPKRVGRVTRLLTSTAVAVAAFAAVPAGAFAAECPATPTTQAFAQFGDTNQYFLAPGGSFESLDGWTLRNSPSLLSGVNPLGLTSDVSSADLDSSDGVTSTSFCVDATMPHLRFAAKYGGGGQLDVTVRTVYGGSSDSSSGSVAPDDHKVWRPSRYVELKTGSIPAGESGVATVTFRSQGDWQIDDVHVDPYRK